MLLRRIIVVISILIVIIILSIVFLSGPRNISWMDFRPLSMVNEKIVGFASPDFFGSIRLNPFR